MKSYVVPPPINVGGRCWWIPLVGCDMMCGTAGGGVEALLDVDVGLPSCLSKNPSSASTTKSAVTSDSTSKASFVARRASSDWLLHNEDADWSSPSESHSSSADSSSTALGDVISMATSSSKSASNDWVSIDSVNRMGWLPVVWAADVTVDGMAGSFKSLHASHLSRNRWSTATSPLGPIKIKPQHIFCL